MKIVADSNLWIAMLNASDNLHKKAQQLFATFNEEVIVPEYVVVEVCTVLKQKRRKALADIFIKKILENPDIQLSTSTPEFFGRVLTAFYRNDFHHLSFVDVSLLVLSQYYRVYTFDKKLATTIKKSAL